MKIIKIKFKALLGCLVAFFICLTMLATIKLDYDVTVPGPLTEVSEVYKIEGHDTNQDVNTVSILMYYRVSILQYLWAKNNPFAIVEKHNDIEDTSWDYQYASGTIQKNVSLSNALICSFELAGKKIDYSYKGEIIHSIYGNQKSPFEIGDIITAVNGVEVSKDKGLSEVLAEICGIRQLGNHYYIDFDLTKTYQFTVTRNGKELTVDAKPFEYKVEDGVVAVLGISQYPYYKVMLSTAEEKISITPPSSIGPSGGLMQSLYLYLSLTDSKLASGLKIVGTGTVEVDGTAGEIGGIESKISAAVVNNADIFFCPAANYEDALKQYNKLPTKMKLVKVESLQDAIDYLERISANE